MLEIGCRGGDAADDRRVERAARRGEQAEEREAGSDLEAARVDVAVRDAIAEEVRERAGERCASSRAGRRAGGRARCDVQRDDQLSMCKTCVGSIR